MISSSNLEKWVITFGQPSDALIFQSLFNHQWNRKKCTLMANIILYLTVAGLINEASVSRLLWNVMIITYWPSHIMPEFTLEFEHWYWFGWLRKSYWNVINIILPITQCSVCDRMVVRLDIEHWARLCHVIIRVGFRPMMNIRNMNIEHIRYGYHEVHVHNALHIIYAYIIPDSISISNKRV